MKFLTAENLLVTELTASTGSQRAALRMIGLSRSSWHYRTRPRERTGVLVPHPERAYPNRIDDEVAAEIAAKIQAAWEAGLSVDHAFAAAWDQGYMRASIRSWWRIAERIEQDKRPRRPARRRGRSNRQVPVLRAEESNQVWSWDITELPAPWRGMSFKLYKITDIFSRKIVGYRVEQRECNQLAVDMFEDAFLAEGGPPLYVHADSGAAMRSKAMESLLDGYGITETHNRPYVSNDNPFSESGFRTIKYRPDYPGTFETIEEARAWIDAYVIWYNTEHHHSGISLFTPQQVHNGSWHSVRDHRQDALDAYYAQHPERFNTRPLAKAPANIVGINMNTHTTE